MKKLRRREQDGLFLDNSEHWEMWETKIFIRNKKSAHNQASISVPIDIVRHLNLENKDLVFVAIKRREGKS